MKKKILYITTWDFTHPEADGVCKKILGQIKAFRNAGYDVEYTYMKDGYTYICINGEEILLGFNHHMSQYGSLRIIGNYVKQHAVYHYVYIRYSTSDHYFIKMIRILHKQGADIIAEVPTYPYDNECRTAREKVVLAIDKMYRSKIQRYINSFASYSDDAVIFGTPAFQIVNGIDVKNVSPVVHVTKDDNTINLIGVAVFTKSHGYDRLIKSLSEYYRKGGTRNIVFHIVGYGRLKDEYAALVEKYNMQEHVVLYGKMYGTELNELYNKMDIGVCTLALSRDIPGMISSELKSREYAAKGLPMISGGPIDIFYKNKYKYALELGDNESVIDINRIIDFYENVYSQARMDVITQIREYAGSHCSMDVSVRPIIEHFN